MTAYSDPGTVTHNGDPHGDPRNLLATVTPNGDAHGDPQNLLAGRPATACEYTELNRQSRNHRPPIQLEGLVRMLWVGQDSSFSLVG